MLSFNGWVLLIAGIALGIGYGNLSSCMQAIAIKVSPSNKYGLATSTYFIGLDIGIVWTILTRSFHTYDFL